MSSNKNLEFDLIIIGAGLTGLTISYLLANLDLNILVLEANSRLGGRIYTQGYQHNKPLELGATWFNAEHKYLSRLLSSLGISSFEQLIDERVIYEAIPGHPYQLVSLPPTDSPSRRITKGSFRLIEELATRSSNHVVQLNSKVISITEKEQYVEVKTDDLKVYRSTKVISTLPPALFINTIICQPTFRDVDCRIMKSTHTWMGESIKVALSYKVPFWRVHNRSGTIFSNVGPITEMYEHSSEDDSFHALKGFLKAELYDSSKPVRLKMILQQLSKYYGDVVDDFIEYQEKVWRNDALSYAAYEHLTTAHQNNGHALYQKGYMNNRLLLSGTETSTQYSGYMEGAIRSAYDTVQRLDVKSID